MQTSPRSREPLDKWQFLAAIANSPRIQKSWEYEARDIKTYYSDLYSLGNYDYLSINACRAIRFAITFMNHFGALSHEHQKQILQILRDVDRDF